MDKYILKISNNYVSGDRIIVGIPQMSSELADAKIFTYDEAMAFLNYICFDPEIIRI